MCVSERETERERGEHGNRNHVEITDLCTNEVIGCNQLEDLGVFFFCDNQLHLVLVQDMIGLDVRFLKLLPPCHSVFISALNSCVLKILCDEVDSATRVHIIFSTDSFFFNLGK